MKPEPNMALIWAVDYLGGGFKYFFFFPILGNYLIWRAYFSDGWFNHQLLVFKSHQTKKKQMLLKTLR